MNMQGNAVALVTGASSGIGAATVRALLADGCTVYAGARRVERMAELEAAGARLLHLDVTDDDSMVAAVARIIAEQGRLDVLVNNAGYGSYGAVEDVPLSEGRAQFEVNVFGLARMTQLALPHMRARSSGRIVNVSSMGGKIYEPLGGWYHATKFAVEGLSDCLRLETAPFGIHVIVIQPGGIATEWGGIAAEGLMRTSGHTAYAAIAKTEAALLAAGEEGAGGSDPAVIGRLIARAVQARRPRTRYSAGAGAKPLLLARKWLSDRAFDRLMLSLARHFERQAGKR
jgi:NAD(P)-dependent dehydrogenase (short-subunit alcohol dehydrogenase family)